MSQSGRYVGWGARRRNRLGGVALVDIHAWQSYRSCCYGLLRGGTSALMSFILEDQPPFLPHANAEWFSLIEGLRAISVDARPRAELPSGARDAS